MKLSKYGFNVALVLLLVPGIARAADPELVQLINKEASLFASTNNSGERSSGSYSPAAPEKYNISGPLAFAIDYGNKGVVRGHGRCSTQDGIELTNLLDTITDETGQTGAVYCYCGLDNYTPLNGTATNLSGPWAYIGFSDESQCASNCAGLCAMQLARWYNYSSDLALQTAVFNAYVSSSKMVTTQTYVDNALNTKQAKITTTGTNKLMTFGNGTGATPGSRDIVTALGTSTSATTVPTVGPIVTAVNNKQNAVNGTADYVMTGTGTAGTLGEKPVYSASVQKSNALVTAQTINTAAMNAANSEMMCHSYVTNASQTPENCLLWEIKQSISKPLQSYWQNPSTAYTSSCYRRAYGNYTEGGIARNDQNGNCSSATVSYLGALNNKSGKWGTVFPYGDISGVSKCVNYIANPGIATDEQINSKSAGGICWCKMQNPIVSKWAIGMNYTNITNCNKACAGTCAALQPSYREVMYSTIE